MFAELCCQSNFTFLTGASHPEEFVHQAHQLGYAGLGLTDEASVSGSVRAHLAAHAVNMPLVHGSVFQLQEGFEVTLLAPNREGWGALFQLISLSRRRAMKGQYVLSHRDLTGLSDDLLCLWHPNPYATNWTDAMNCLQYRFKGRLWIAAHLPENGHQALWAERIYLTAFEWNLPVIATMRPLMHSRRRLKLQHTLTAIRLKQPLSEIADHLEPSSERCLLPLTALESRYPAP